MRTTVELSEATYRLLRAAAIERGVRGFSPIVEEAVNRYLEAEDDEGESLRAFEAAKGAWSDVDVEDFEEARTQAWSSWRFDRS